MVWWYMLRICNVRYAYKRVFHNLHRQYKMYVAVAIAVHINILTFVWFFESNTWIVICSISPHTSVIYILSNYRIIQIMSLDTIKFRI